MVPHSHYQNNDDARRNKMFIVDNYKKMLLSYKDYKGKTSLSEFWYAILVNCIIVFTVNILVGLLSLGLISNYSNSTYTAINFMMNLLNLIVLIFFVILAIPTFAMAVRRMRDTGLSEEKVKMWLMVNVGLFFGLIIRSVFPILNIFMLPIYVYQIYILSRRSQYFSGN